MDSKMQPLCLRQDVIQRSNGRSGRYVREMRRHYRPREAFRSNRNAFRRIAFWTPVINAPTSAATGSPTSLALS